MASCDGRVPPPRSHPTSATAHSKRARKAARKADKGLVSASNPATEPDSTAPARPPNARGTPQNRSARSPARRPAGRRSTTSGFSPSSVITRTPLWPLQRCATGHHRGHRGRRERIHVRAVVCARTTPRARITPRRPRPVVRPRPAKGRASRARAQADSGRTNASTSLTVTASLFALSQNIYG